MPENKFKPYYQEVDEYTSPKDFYYALCDIFMNYDEAEEHYYERGGE